jgi:hypothetical protein
VSPVFDELLSEVTVPPRLGLSTNLTPQSSLIKDQEFVCIGIYVAAATFPPGNYRVHSECRCFGAGPDHHQTVIGLRIVDSIGDSYPLGVASEVMVFDDLRFALPLYPGILEFPNQLFLFRIHADDRLAVGGRFLPLPADV